MRNNYKFIRQLAIDNNIEDFEGFLQYVRKKCKVDINKCIQYFKIKEAVK